MLLPRIRPFRRAGPGRRLRGNLRDRLQRPLPHPPRRGRRRRRPPRRAAAARGRSSQRRQTSPFHLIEASAHLTARRVGGNAAEPDAPARRRPAGETHRPLPGAMQAMAGQALGILSQPVCCHCWRRSSRPSFESTQVLHPPPEHDRLESTCCWHWSRSSVGLHCLGGPARAPGAVLCLDRSIAQATRPPSGTPASVPLTPAPPFPFRRSLSSARRARGPGGAPTAPPSCPVAPRHGGGSARARRARGAGRSGGASRVARSCGAGRFCGARHAPVVPAVHARRTGRAGPRGAGRWLPRRRVAPAVPAARASAAAVVPAVPVPSPISAPCDARGGGRPSETLPASGSSRRAWRVHAAMTKQRPASHVRFRMWSNGRSARVAAPIAEARI